MRNFIPFNTSVLKLFLPKNELRSSYPQAGSTVTVLRRFGRCSPISGGRQPFQNTAADNLRREYKRGHRSWSLITLCTQSRHCREVSRQNNDALAPRQLAPDNGPVCLQGWFVSTVSVQFLSVCVFVSNPPTRRRWYGDQHSSHPQQPPRCDICGFNSIESVSGFVFFL